MSFQLTGWILVAAIALALGLFMAGVIQQPVLEAVLATIGVGGIAGLRALINSSGKKTYIIAGVGALAVALYAFGIITEQVFGVVIFSVLGIAVPTLGHAVAKTPETQAALKK